MNNLVLADFEQTCRACMMNFDGENLQSLFDYIDGNDTRSHRMICEVLNSTVQNLPKIEIMDSLPKNLCTNCVEKLCAFDKFQNCCVQSDRKLRELVVAKLTQITDDSTADPLIHSELKIDELIKDEMIKEEIENFQAETIQQEGDDSINKANDFVEEEQDEQVDNQFTCDVCNEKFLYKRNLMKHANRTHGKVELKKKSKKVKRKARKVDSDSEDEAAIEKREFSCDEVEKSNKSKPNIEVLFEKDSVTIEDNAGGTLERVLDVNSVEWPKHVLENEASDSKILKMLMNNIHNEELLQNEGLTTKTKNVKGEEALTNAGSASGARNPLYKCNECEKAFHKKVHLRKHKYHHRRPGGLKKEKRNCDACGQEFKTLQNLREHFSSAHPERLEVANQTVETLLKLYICQFCNKNFQHPSSLKVHLRVHTKEQPFLCPHCGKAFNSSSSLGEHILRHEAERKYECPDCPKKFLCLSDLASHKQMHNNVKPHICDICSAAFYKPYRLKIHKMYHNGEKRYQCEYCDMRFVCGEHLRRHARTHTGEKPYKCKYCPRTYSQSNDLNRHLRTHLGENVYQCELCPLTFRLAAELRKHFALHKNDDEETKKRNKIAWQEAQEQLKMKLKSNIPLVSRKIQDGTSQTEINLLVESKDFL